ncbi:hypothetical protein BpHYR1_008817 [Brachionus plicatilis]|uniref:Transmembrane protein n=1 Tax=Brachionus plicatilis TaxID=10195 RepID=A0A3M7R6R0_BRAPC|nr:hypothetical protein BpHYR1_008817 [Brachionus plicatilis]
MNWIGKDIPLGLSRTAKCLLFRPHQKLFIVYKNFYRSQVSVASVAQCGLYWFNIYIYLNLGPHFDLLNKSELTNIDFIDQTRKQNIKLCFWKFLRQILKKENLITIDLCFFVSLKNAGFKCVAKIKIIIYKLSSSFLIFWLFLSKLLYLDYLADDLFFLVIVGLVGSYLELIH